ncbi:uncharacterized protein LOC125945878 [Dermacentor silvarum]|uniref:uncharacterized protein LOC125945878 n=1 Tax=Dermacentor silvarum TaxID=543639 RepID=UPI0021014694|nr:uncharacterized protein LOC125945878 [Dermacentor silvarum]
MQVLIAIASAILLGVDDERALLPLSPKPSSSREIGWATATTKFNSGLPVITGLHHRLDEALVNDELPVSAEHQGPRDINQTYLNAQHFGFVGFGAGTLADMQLTPLLVMQVSTYYPMQVHGPLCALPAPPMISATAHPRRRMCARLSCRNFRLFVNRVLYLILLLLLSGDVELNPGPLTEAAMEVLKSLQTGQAAIMSKLDTIDTRLAKHEAMLAEVNSRLGVTEERVETVNKLLSDQASATRSLEQQVSAVRNKNVDLENRSRRLNLIFYGIDDGNHSETWIQSENLVKSICKANLGIELNSIQRAHRVGHYSVRFKRPVLVNFSSYKEKQDVLSNAHKFKGSPYSVDQDYSSETRQIRKHLWEYAKVKKSGQQ